MTSGTSYDYHSSVLSVKFSLYTGVSYIILHLFFLALESSGAMADGDKIKPCPPADPFVSAVEDGFGFITDEDGNRQIVRRYTLSNQNFLAVQIINYGGTITSIKYPDKYGVSDDIVLGYEDIEGYQTSSNPYFGAIIGRYANRIAKGHFKLDKNDYQLTVNSGEHHLHGGFKGFDKVLWESEIRDNKLILTYLSRDGEEGYPGELLVSATYEVTTDNELILTMKANTTKATPINLTQHSYFNLAGHGTGPDELYKHIFSINADKYTVTDEEQIPTGMLKNVGGTLWDLRAPRVLGDMIDLIPGGGYDHNFCIHKTASECRTFIARVIHPGSGRVLEIYSDQPGVQFYTGNKLPRLSAKSEDEEHHGPVQAHDPETDIKGKNGVYYHKHQAFCLETQNYPDAVNHAKVMPVSSGMKRCPICGYFFRDPDFENPQEECCSDVILTGKRPPPPPENKNKIIGKDGSEYFRHCGFVLTTQKYPDSVHRRKNFPNSILRPGEDYDHVVLYKFTHYEEVELEPEDTEEFTQEWEGEGEQDFTPAKDDLLDAKLEENGR